MNKGEDVRDSETSIHRKARKIFLDPTLEVFPFISAANRKVSVFSCHDKNQCCGFYWEHAGICFP